MVESYHKSGPFPALMDPLRAMSSRVADWFAPASEAAVNGAACRIARELPGFVEGDIEVSVHDGVVTVSGQKSARREEEGATYFFSERTYGAFSRSFRLPPDADANAVEAGLEDGLLTIRVPKMAPRAAEGAQMVPIRAGREGRCRPAPERGSSRPSRPSPARRTPPRRSEAPGSPRPRS